MAFIDNIQLHISAGKGGNGVVRWRREKYIEKGGPAGGDGGRGGDVFVMGVKDNTYLQKYAGVNSMVAENGNDGGSKALYGEKGQDLIIKVPIGTQVTNLSTGESYDIIDIEPVQILRGGKGGLGNIHFKSSTNQTPRQQTDGEIGESADFNFDLKLIADVGLVGLPNAGKSTLINFLTNSKSKIGNYEFTTLEPHLGMMDKIIIADIPGLIEGASEGKGLGHKFLQHIERTKLIVHCISLESTDLLRDYQTIKKELESYSDKLINKPQIVVLTKSDTVDQGQIDQATEQFPSALPVSVLEEESLKKLHQIIITTLEPL